MHSLKHLSLGLVQDLDKLLKSTEADDRLGLRTVSSLVGSQTKQSSEDAHDGLRACEVVKAHVVLGLVSLEGVLVHGSPLVEHLERAGDSDSQRVFSGQDLVQSLHLEQVSFEVCDLKLSNSAKWGRELFEDRFKGRRSQESEDDFGQLDGSQQGLVVVNVLQTLNDQVDEILEHLVILRAILGGVQALTSKQESDDDLSEVGFVLLLQGRGQQGLNEQSCDVGNHLHLLLPNSESGNIIDRVLGELGCLLGASLSKVLHIDGHRHLCFAYPIKFIEMESLVVADSVM